MREVETHMKKECQGRLVKCEQGCGKWVKVCYKEHHEEIEARLLRSIYIQFCVAMNLAKISFFSKNC